MMKKMLVFIIIAFLVGMIAWFSIGDSGFGIFIKPM